MSKERINLIVEKMSDKAVIMTRATANSAGLDLTAVSYEMVDEGMHGVVKFHTDLKVEIPNGYFGAIYIRSGLGKKGKWMLANDVGIIDSDYRGELMIMMRYVAGSRFMQNSLPKSDITDLLGTRIAQLIIQPYASNIIIKKGTLDNTVRGEGGFGSTS